MTFMTERRQSKRPETVSNSESLKKKLEEKSNKADLRKQKLRSKQLQKLQEEELELYTAEAAKLCELADRLLQCDSESETTGDQSFHSLEWDNSEETPPSFLEENRGEPSISQQFTRHVSDTGLVDEIVQEILNPDNTEEVTQGPTDQETATRNSSRRNTSTDNQFLDLDPAISDSNFQALQWPPRFPSQEPEFRPYDSSSLVQESSE